MTERPCTPKQQIYKGKPGTILVCPDCQRAMEGIRYTYGIGLLTLPIHYDPLRQSRVFAHSGPKECSGNGRLAAGAIDLKNAGRVDQY